MRARVMKGGATYINGVLYIPTTSIEQYKVIDYKEEHRYDNKSNGDEFDRERPNQ